MNRALFLLPLIAGIVASTPVAGQSNTYVDTLAGYSIVYPLGTSLTSGFDAALGFNTVFIQFPETYEGEYAGVTISIFDNPEGKYVEQFARERFNLRRDAPGRVRGEWINGMPALLANRPSPLTGEDAAVALIEGDGVIIRIALLGSDSNGRLEPMTTHYDWFNQIAHSIQRVPREAPAPEVTIDTSETASIAAEFQMPFNVPAASAYAEQYGVAISDTTYAVRNLDLEHRRTCFGVDWPRLLHTGIDWFRADGQYQIPTNVYAVADGVVDWYDPFYNSYPGKVVIIRHTLQNGRSLYSVYAHLGPDVSIVQGQVVAKGQRIGSLLDQGDNTHLHFEMRWFLDGRNIYGAYTACNSSTLIVGRGYTYRVSPNDFPASGNGYVDPRDFINAGMNYAVIPQQAMATVLTSTLRLAADQPLTAIKAQTNRATLLNAPFDLPETFTQTSPLSATFTLSTTEPYTNYLPIIGRNFPVDGPVCIDGEALLSNSGFEDGMSNAPWVQVSNGTANLIQDERPYTGTYSLWFGGRNIADEEALQSFVLPHFTQGITLTLQLYLTTTETQPTPFDTLEIVIENTRGIEITPRVVLDNSNAQKDVWVPETIVFDDLQTLGGTRMQLSIKIATDNSLPTSFFVDNVQALTTCIP